MFEDVHARKVSLRDLIFRILTGTTRNSDDIYWYYTPVLIEEK